MLPWVLKKPGSRRNATQAQQDLAELDVDARLLAARPGTIALAEERLAAREDEQRHIDVTERRIATGDRSAKC